jgi:fructose-1,6-bisphosphatase I/sedoheptulose-1,7-bisphosphatase
VDNPDESTVLGHARQIVASGYAIYGPSTMLMLTVGQGVVGFTLDPNFGEFLMTRSEVRVLDHTRQFAVDASNRRHWPQPVQRYVDECLAGRSGPRGVDFSMRWMGSVVADAHRILLQGGICIYPRDQGDSSKTGQADALFVARPVAHLIEQAGGRASTGFAPVDSVDVSHMAQREPLIFGCSAEVERIEQFKAVPLVW